MLKIFQHILLPMTLHCPEKEKYLYAIHSYNLHLFYITVSSLSHCSDTDPFSHICHCVLGIVTKR